jgi:cytosine/adenosine deaminase-related metal-dependent hydrolase
MDMALLADSGATIAHNPRSNMNNGVGYARVGAMRNPIVLGTDGLGSDMLTEARFACFKGADAGAAVTPQRAVEMLASSARRASESLGVTLGRLEPGAAADLVVTEYVPPTPLDEGNLAGHLLFALDGAWVRDVMIGGHRCLNNGRVCSVEAAEEAVRARAAAEALWRRMAELP